MDSRTVRSAVVGVGLAAALVGVDLSNSPAFMEFVNQLQLDEGLRIGGNLGMGIMFVLTWIYRVNRRAP